MYNSMYMYVYVYIHTYICFCVCAEETEEFDKVCYLVHIASQGEEEEKKGREGKATAHR